MPNKVPHKRSKMGQGKRKPKSIRKYLRKLKKLSESKKPDLSKILVAKPALAINYDSLRYALDIGPRNDCPHCHNIRDNVVSSQNTNLGRKLLVICGRCSCRYIPLGILTTSW